MDNDTLNLEHLKVSIIPKKTGKILALATLTYGEMELRGFKVTESQYDPDGILIQPPSLQTGSGKWLRIVWFTNPERWEEIRGKIRHEYLKPVPKRSEQDEETEDSAEKAVENYFKDIAQ